MSRSNPTPTAAGLAAARAEGIAEGLERCAKAALSARFGPPSMWGSDRPQGWHMERPPTPEEASHHDNGVLDAFKAIRSLPPSADGGEG